MKFVFKQHLIIIFYHVVVFVHDKHNIYIKPKFAFRLFKKNHAALRYGYHMLLLQFFIQYVFLNRY